MNFRCKRRIYIWLGRFCDVGLLIFAIEIFPRLDVEFDVYDHTTSGLSAPRAHTTLAGLSLLASGDPLKRLVLVPNLRKSIV